MSRGVRGRIADGVRTGRAVGDTVGFPRTATDGPTKGRPGAVPAPCAGRRPASFRRGGHRDRGRASGAAGRGIRCPGAGGGRSWARQGAVPGRALTGVIHPIDRRSLIRADRLIHGRPLLLMDRLSWANSCDELPVPSAHYFGAGRGPVCADETERRHTPCAYQQAR
jgi:hypothetical protein